MCGVLGESDEHVHNVLGENLWNVLWISDQGSLARYSGVDSLDPWIDRSMRPRTAGWLGPVAGGARLDATWTTVMQFYVEMQRRSHGRSGREDDGEGRDWTSEAGLCDLSQEKKNSGVIEHVRFERREGIEIGEAEWRSEHDGNCIEEGTGADDDHFSQKPVMDSERRFLRRGLCSVVFLLWLKICLEILSPHLHSMARRSDGVRVPVRGTDCGT